MKYAYIDEYGAFGFKFEDPGCTASMILTAVLVDDEDVSTMEMSAQDISLKYFGEGEMKSKSIVISRVFLNGFLLVEPFNFYPFI